MTLRKLFAFWAPLEATWLMMALEGPFLAALIARLDAPKINLAAYGVALALALLVEAPVIMIMSAATALATDARAYRKLRNFTFALCAAVTLLLGVTQLPPVFALLARLMDLPDAVSTRTWVALMLFLPWPAAIGYRRLYQGILIRDNSTRQVAAGTLVRLLSMTTMGLLLASARRLDGAAVGAASLSFAVVVEAIACRWMARRAVRRVLETRLPEATVPMGYRDIARFYYPLALTSMLNMGIQPIVTFFLARAWFPLESLAALPVVNSLVFLFRTFGLAGQETTIAALSRDPASLPVVRAFSRLLAVVASGGLALLALTPLIGVWLEHISGLAPSLAQFAVHPARILALMPAMTVWMCWQRGVLVVGKSTAAVTVSTVLEVGSVVAVMLLGSWVRVPGITLAAGALVVGRIAGILYLVPAVQRAAAKLIALSESIPAQRPATSPP